MARGKKGIREATKPDKAEKILIFKLDKV